MKLRRTLHVSVVFCVLALLRPFGSGAQVVVTGAGSFNRLGGDFHRSDFMTGTADLFVSNDLEVRGLLLLSRAIWMEAATSGLSDSDQAIFFYDNNSSTDEFVLWDESENSFRLSSDLVIDGEGTVAYLTARFGTLQLESEDFFQQYVTETTVTNPFFNWLRRNPSSGSMTPLMQLSGPDLRIAGQLTENFSFDLAESFWMQEKVEAGELVRVDSDRPDAVRRSRGAYDPATIGVVSAEPGIVMGGGAFSVDALRERWGDEVVAEFKKLRPRLLRRVLAESPELRERSERLRSPAAFQQYLASLTGQDAPAVPRSTLEGESGFPHEPNPRAGSVPSPSPEQGAKEFLHAKKDMEVFLETMVLQEFFEERFAAVALAGRVPVRVDASHGAIEIGDPLAASPTPGVAMVATEPGFIIGTALEQLAVGTGEVLALVSRSWHGGKPGTGPGGGRAHETDLQRAPLDSRTGTIADRALVPPESEVASHELPHLTPEEDLAVRGSIGAPSGPLAEYHLVSEPVEAGEVVVVDRQLADAVKIAETAADPAVVGIVSGSPGVILGGRVAALSEVLPELAAAYEEARQRHDLDEQLRLWSDLSRAFHTVHAPVAVSGTVTTKADASYGPIGVGELLTSSPTRGHVMRATDPAPGTIVAKALEPLEAGTGKIRVLVMLR